MKIIVDFLGKEIQIGDNVVAMRHRGTSSFLYKGRIIRFIGKTMVEIETVPDENEWGLYDVMRVSAYKVVVIKE